VKGREKFKRGMAEGSLFEIRLIQMSLRKGKRKRERERARLVSKQSLIEDGTLVRWNNSSYITAQRETGSAEGRKEEGCRDNNLKKWYRAG
jgi:hypothetical protein